MRFVGFVLACALGLPAAGGALCVASAQPATLDDLVARVRAERWRNVFVGERHGVGPVKRFAVDLANALAADGSDVALYVEGFRRGCAPRDESCWSVARAFNRDAFATLAAEARVPVHPLDPVERDGRVERMAAILAAGGETVRVVLVGKTHVVHAADASAEWRVWGGGVRYPHPGDLARALAAERSLTIGLETRDGVLSPYRLQLGGCGYHYVVTTADAADYWAGGEAPGSGDSGATASAGTAAAAAPR